MRIQGETRNLQENISISLCKAKIIKKVNAAETPHLSRKTWKYFHLEENNYIKHTKIISLNLFLGKFLKNPFFFFANKNVEK